MEFDLLKNSFNKEQVKNLNPLVLAFVGDAVYELLVRSYIVSENRNTHVHKLHIKAVSFVKANAQSEFIKILIEDLNSEELSIYKRGRNSKSGTVPKNADICEYRAATGFEAVFGYLYLTKQNDRINYFIEKIIKIRMGEE